jgi:predicted 3-demethylubiquinone-9 3-methyltransferase (glyoxalase superfamily)
VSWQVVPNFLDEIFADESAGAQRAMEAMLRMKKFDLAELRRAAGEADNR